METFGEWLRIELERRNLSQKQLAERSGITPSQISRIISGSRGVGEESILAIAHALRLPPEEVFRVAGFLPPEKDPGPFTKEMEYLLTLLPTEKQQQVIEYIRFLAQQQEQEKKGRNATRGMENAQPEVSQ